MACISNAEWMFWEALWEKTSMCNPEVSKFFKFTLWKMHYGFRQISTFSFNKRLRAHEKTGGGGSTIALNMSVKLENIFNEVSQKSFWAALTTNKNSMTYFLSKYKRLCHPAVVRCTSDADTMNVFIVLDHSCTGGNVELIAADTDLLIMLVHFWNSLIRRDNYEAWGYKKA